MPEATKQLRRVSDSDQRLMARVREIVMQARIAEAILNSHLAAEYQIENGSTILADGTISEPADSSGEGTQ